MTRFMLSGLSRRIGYRAFFLLILLLACRQYAHAVLAEPLALNFVRAPGAVTIDGHLGDWVLTAPVSYEVDPNAFDQKVKTYAMWDDRNLYLAYAVNDASPMKNAGDDPSGAFKSGDTLHFYLSTGKDTAVKRVDGGPEDYHVLMTIQRGKPVIFAFRQQKAGVDKPTLISSPATHIEMAWMGPVPEAELAVAPAPQGYIAEVKLPLAFFDGFKPQPGQSVAVDAAVNFSDSAGNKNMAKVWWSRGASQILDIPTELRFERDKWGLGIFRNAGELPIVIDSSDMFVVPAPGAVTIDGDLKDWDLSCAYGPAYVDPALKEKYNITWAAMYDAQALYLGAIFKSAQPFTNDGGVNNVWWQGDSMEFRFAADPKNQGGDIKKNMDIMTFGVWYNAKEQKDYAALQRSFNFEISDNSAVAVRSQEVPGGRTFEVRVPWSLVKSGNAPIAGDAISWTMAAIWKGGLRAFGMGSISSFRGMGDWGKAHFLANGKPQLVYLNLHQPEATEAVAAVKYTTTVEAAEKGLLSAGVYDADGRLLRTLLAGKPVTAGKVEIGWDGNTDEGQAAAPGKYTVRAVLNAGLHAQYATSACSPGKPPHDSDNPRGGWGGVWGNVIDIAADAHGLYPLWAMEEGDGALMQIDEDGNLLWRQHIPLALHGSQTAVASNGKYVYCAVDSGDKTGLWRVRCADGGYAPFPHEGNNPLEFYLAGVAKSAVPVKGREGDMLLPACNGLAADAGTLYTSALHQDQVACFDAETGKPVKTYSVDRPMGICLDGPDALLVCSGARIVRLDLKTGASTTLVSKGLSAPQDVAVDAKGMIVVTDRGTSQQIKRFDRNGKLLGTFGKAGGRTNNGKYLVDHLRNPAGIAVAASGRIFFSENAEPRVFVRLSSALKYEKLWSGPWYLSGEVTVDPYVPTNVYMWGSQGAFVRHVIDYTNKTSRPDAVWSDFALPSDQIGRWFPRVIQHKGKKYLFCSGSTASLFRIDGDKMLLIAAVGANPKNAKMPMWAFTDLNENGRLDDGEKIDFPPPADPQFTYRGSYWSGSIDDRDMTIYLMTNQYSPNPVTLALTPAFTRPGVPVYDFSDMRAIPMAAMHKPGKPSSPSSIWHTPDGGIFGNADANGSDPRGIGHSSHLSDVFVYRLDRNGKLLWRAGKKASGIAKLGEFYGRACGLGGPIGDQYFDFVDENGQDKVYTVDGLFVGNLLEDTATAVPSENTLFVEHFNSIVFQNALDKKWYFVAGAGGYASIWEIAGLDKITRLQTQVEVK